MEANFSLGVEPVDRDVLKKPPRKVTDPMIDTKLIVNIIISATVIVVGTLCVFYAEVCRTDGRRLARLGVLSSADARRQSHTERHHHDIHLFRLLRHVQRPQLPISGIYRLRSSMISCNVLLVDEIHLRNRPVLQSILSHRRSSFHRRSDGCDLLPTVTIRVSN